MLFGVKNKPHTYQKTMIKFFYMYMNVFMKIVLDNFTVFGDITTHIETLEKCFLKCREFNINLNIDKCAFMVFSRTILGFIVSKERKTLNHNKIEAIVNMLVPTTPQEIQMFK